MSAEKEKNFSEKVEKIIQEIESLSVLELANLVKALEEKFGVQPFPQVISQPPGAPTSQVPAASPAGEEKTSFSVVLTGVGENRIEAIKLVKEVTQKGLKEAKDLVDQVASAPQVIKENVDKKEAEELKAKFEKIGCKVELR